MIKAVLDIHTDVTTSFSLTSIFMSAFTLHFPARILPATVTADMFTPSPDLTSIPHRRRVFIPCSLLTQRPHPAHDARGAQRVAGQGKNAKRKTTKRLLLVCYLSQMRTSPHSILRASANGYRASFLAPFPQLLELSVLRALQSRLDVRRDVAPFLLLRLGSTIFVLLLGSTRTTSYSHPPIF